MSSSVPYLRLGRQWSLWRASVSSTLLCLLLKTFRHVNQLLGLPASGLLMLLPFGFLILIALRAKVAFLMVCQSIIHATHLQILQHSNKIVNDSKP